MVLEYPEGKYDDITTLLDYPVATQSGRMITLRDIADVEYITTLPSITPVSYTHLPLMVMIRNSSMERSLLRRRLM